MWITRKDLRFPIHPGRVLTSCFFAQTYCFHRVRKCEGVVVEFSVAIIVCYQHLLSSTRLIDLVITQNGLRYLLIFHT